MAFEFPGQMISLHTTQDLSAWQYRPVDLNSGGHAIKCVTTGGFCLGIQQNTPSTAGGAVTVMISGVSKAVFDSTACNSTLGVRAAVHVDSTAGGLGPSTGTGYIIGRALSGLSSGSTGTFSLFISHEGNSSGAPIIPGAAA